MATLTGQFISTTYFPLLQIGGTTGSGTMDAWPSGTSTNIINELLLSTAGNSRNKYTLTSGIGTRVPIVVIDHSESTTGDSSFGGLFLRNQTEVPDRLFGFQTRVFNGSEGLSFVQAIPNFTPTILRQSRMFLTSTSGGRGALFVGFTGTELSGNTGTYLTSGSTEHELYVKSGIMFPDTGTTAGFITSERSLTIRTRNTGNLILSTQNSTGSILLIGESTSSLFGAITLTTVPSSSAGNINIITGSNTPSNIVISTRLGSGNILLSTQDSNNITISSGADSSDGLVLTRPSIGGGTTVVTIRPTGANTGAILNIDANSDSDTTLKRGILIRSNANESLILKRSPIISPNRRLFIGGENQPWDSTTGSYEGGIVMYGNPLTLELRGTNNTTNGRLIGKPQLEIHGEVKLFPPLSGSSINLPRIAAVNWATPSGFESFTFTDTGALQQWQDDRWVQYLFSEDYDRFITNAAFLTITSPNERGVHFGVDFAVADVGQISNPTTAEEFWVGGFTILATRSNSTTTTGRGSCNFFLPAGKVAYIRRTTRYTFELNDWTDGTNDINTLFYMRSKQWKLGRDTI